MDRLQLPPEARALLDAVVGIGADLDLRGVLSRIVEAACELTDAEYGVLGIVDDEGSFVDLVPSGVTAERFQQIGRLPEGHGLLGLVPREKRSVRVEHVAEHPVSTGTFPESHPVIDRFLGAPVMVGEEAFGHLYLGNKRTGAPFTATDQALVEALGRTAGVMIDHARTWEQTEFRRRWLELMATVSSRGADTPAGTQRVHLLLGELVAALRELCEAEGAALVHLREGGLLEVGQTSGEPGVAESAVERLADTIRQSVAETAPVRLAVGRATVEMVVPVQSRLGGAGALVVSNAPEPPGLDGLMLDLLAVSAERIALILDRDQALRDRARLVIAKDRDRIARDLHDLVIQRLFATGMQLQAAQSLDEAQLRQRVRGAVDELDGTIQELRSTIFELSARTDRPLLEDVRSLLGEYSEVLGFRPVLRAIGPVDRALIPEAGTHVLTTLRELLSNAARHAEASTMTVELNAGSAWFALRVTDDGLGFDPETVVRGRGSENLRSRTEELGGHLAVTSAPGRGTTVEWVIPAMG